MRRLFLAILMILLSNIVSLEAQVVRLAWQPNQEPDVIRYCIFRDIIENPLQEIAIINRTQTIFIDSNVVAGNTYFYRMVAIDSTENISDYSDDIEVFIPTKTTPVELSQLSATVKKNGVMLNWTTTSETNILGFEVQKSPDRTTFQKIGFVPGAGTSTTPQKYKYFDKKTQFATTYYRLKVMDMDGLFYYSDTINVFDQNSDASNSLKNYPNPFNPETTIEYIIKTPGQVKIGIYDLLGREVTELVNEFQPSGSHFVTWNGKDRFGLKVSSGVYFCRLESQDGFSTRKLLLQK